jgi:hypothetical protein
MMLTLISNLEASKRQPQLYHLVSCSEEVLWRQILNRALGEKYVTTISKLLPAEDAKVVGKYVGMLIELPPTEVVQLLEHPDQLQDKLDEAIEIATDLRQEPEVGVDGFAHIPFHSHVWVTCDDSNWPSKLMRRKSSRKSMTRKLIKLIKEVLLQS